MTDGESTFVYKNILAHIARRVEGSEHALVAQAAAAKPLNDSVAMLNLRVPDSAPPLDSPDGPLNVRTFVVSESGEQTGEIIVWVRGGYVVCLEQAWYVGDAPLTWPDTECLAAG